MRQKHTHMILYSAEYPVGHGNPQQIIATIILYMLKLYIKLSIDIRVTRPMTLTIGPFMIPTLDSVLILF